MLERVPVDTMTFQNALGHDYLSEATNVSVSVTEAPANDPPGFPAVVALYSDMYGEKSSGLPRRKTR